MISELQANLTNLIEKCIFCFWSFMWILMSLVTIWAISGGWAESEAIADSLNAHVCHAVAEEDHGFWAD